MKRGKLIHWKNVDECTNLLFFSQLVNELLFDYSIPSNRIATLNSHYLCLDAIDAIESIDNHGVPEGTLKPIMEELYVALQKDPVFVDLEPISPLQFFVKYQGNSYVLSTKVSDLNYNELKKAATTINGYFFKDNSYYEMMQKRVISIVKGNNADQQKELFRLVKSLLTELMNFGYSLKFIYEVMNQNFWNPRVDITSPDDIKLFFDKFTFKRMPYDVVFRVNQEHMRRFLGYINGLEFDANLKPRFEEHTEKAFYNKRNKDTFLQVKIEAVDPFSAADHAKDMLMLNAALYRLYDHTYRYDIRTAPYIVYDEYRFYTIGKMVGAVEHKRNMSSKAISESMSLSEKALHEAVSNQAIRDFLSIVNAAKFHAHSLDSASEENQLLDFWSIFESVLDISNKNTGDRIQQVCMHLVPILKRKYFYSLFEQLASDIKNYNEELFADIVGNDTEIKTVVQKVCEFTLLDEYKEKREAFLTSCSDFPLLKERIGYYSSLLSDTSAVHRFVEKHGERVRWQVMRIYRNRNLIIHNGQTMPYLSLLIENLHSYVDDFLFYSIHSLSKGLDIDSMCQELFVKECSWNAKFQRKKCQLDSSLIQDMLTL